MRMQLFAVEFVSDDGFLTSHIVAPSITIATDFATEYHDEIDEEVFQTAIFRIDENLPDEYRAGLDDMLENAPIGFASRSTQFGWYVHTTLKPRSTLFTIHVEDESDVHVVAPNPDIASLIWIWSRDLDEDGTHPFWTISSSTEWLSERQAASLNKFIDYALTGVISWDEERGWSAA